MTKPRHYYSFDRDSVTVIRWHSQRERRDAILAGRGGRAITARYAYRLVHAGANATDANAGRHNG